MMRTSRGGSNIGCLVVLALIVAGGYVGYKFALVQWDYESVKEELTEIVRFWVTQDSAFNPEIIRQEIIRKAERHKVYINPEDIEIQRADNGALTINVYWETPIEFPGGYVYNRQFSVERHIRRY